MRLLLVGVLGCLACGERAGPAHPPPAPKKETPVRIGSHGMIAFGRGGQFYLSHIPMFRAPHDVQLILRAGLVHPSWNEPPDLSDRLYTLVPEELDLTRLADGRLRRFKGTIYEGNFEANGVERWKGVSVAVEEVLAFRPLTGRAPELPALEYWLVAAGRRAYLVHAITRPPDFDQVVEVALESPSLDSAITRVRFPGAANSPDQRLRAGERRDAVAGDAPVRVVVERELSYLVGPDFIP